MVHSSDIILGGYIISQPGFQHLKQKHVSLAPL